MIYVSVPRCLTWLWSLCAGSLSHEAFAEVERQRLLRGWGHWRAGGLGAEILGKSLRQSACERLQLRRVQTTSSHQLAHLYAAVQVQGQDPERGKRRPVPDISTGSSLGSVIHVTPRAVVVVLVERVGLWLKLVPYGVRGIWASTFGLECVDGRMVLGLVLRRQRWALWASLKADAVSEDIQRTHAFDGAEATQRSSDKVARQSGEEHTWGRIHRIPSVRLQLLWFGLEGQEGGGHGGQVRGEGHVDRVDGGLDGLQRRDERRRRMDSDNGLHAQTSRANKPLVCASW